MPDIDDEPIASQLERHEGRKVSTDCFALACCSRDGHERLSGLKEGDPIASQLEMSVGPKISKKLRRVGLLQPRQASTHV